MRRAALTALVVVLTLGLALVDLCAGETWVPPAEAMAALLDPSAPQAFLVRELRAGHVAGALVVGLCLGMSGAISQSLLRNPLASPDIVGVTAGAGCAAVAALLGAGVGSFAPGSAGVSVALAACVGGMLAGLLVVALAWSAGIDTRRVVLVGLGVNAGLTALSSWLLARADLPDIAAATVWLTGSLSAASLGSVAPAAWGTAVLLGLSAVTGRTLDVLRLDELTARSLGVRVPLAQLVQAVLCVAAASLACSVAGPVAFVAFCAPQVAAALLRTAGPPVLGGALVGALLVVAADLAARTLFPAAVPVGLVTSFCGAPVLLWLLLRFSSTPTTPGGRS